MNQSTIFLLYNTNSSGASLHHGMQSDNLLSSNAWEFINEQEYTILYGSEDDRKYTDIRILSKTKLKERPKSADALLKRPTENVEGIFIRRASSLSSIENLLFAKRVPLIKPLLSENEIKKLQLLQEECQLRRLKKYVSNKMSFPKKTQKLDFEFQDTETTNTGHFEDTAPILYSNFQGKKNKFGKISFHDLKNTKTNQLLLQNQKVISRKYDAEIVKGKNNPLGKSEKSQSGLKSRNVETSQSKRYKSDQSFKHAVNYKTPLSEKSKRFKEKLEKSNKHKSKQKMSDLSHSDHEKTSIQSKELYKKTKSKISGLTTSKKHKSNAGLGDLSAHHLQPNKKNKKDERLQDKQSSNGSSKTESDKFKNTSKYKEKKKIEGNDDSKLSSKLHKNEIRSSGSPKKDKKVTLSDSTSAFQDVDELGYNMHKTSVPQGKRKNNSQKSIRLKSKIEKPAETTDLSVLTDSEQKAGKRALKKKDSIKNSLLTQKGNKISNSIQYMIQYILSNPVFIQFGWTLQPVDIAISRLITFKTLPANPKTYFFRNRTENEKRFYHSGSLAVDILETGTGKINYPSGFPAIVTNKYHSYMKLVLQSDPKNDPLNKEGFNSKVIGIFDSYGNGVVYDSEGNTVLSFNQSEGVFNNSAIKTPYKWKWAAYPVVEKQRLKLLLDSMVNEAKPTSLKKSVSPSGSGGSKKPVIEKKSETNKLYEDLVAELPHPVAPKPKRTSNISPTGFKSIILKVSKETTLRINGQDNMFLNFSCDKLNYKIDLGVIIDTETVERINDLAPDKIRDMTCVFDALTHHTQI